jgi:hypothetical protein
MNRKPSLTRAWYPVFLQAVAFVVFCGGGSIAGKHHIAGGAMIVAAVILWAVGFGYRAK